ncbi:hypothetical protein SynPROSU1_02253 [Synechococcus sp. PROS-U-1]|nr:hypothetical protein SynPROSU1_02253 [Synechococcus sp. PROS-U-1]
MLIAAVWEVMPDGVQSRHQQVRDCISWLQKQKKHPLRAWITFWGCRAWLVRHCSSSKALPRAAFNGES